MANDPDELRKLLNELLNRLSNVGKRKTERN